MSRLRRAYYDRFSRCYDRFVELHSRADPGRPKAELAARVRLRPGGRVLDLCTGTGAMLPRLAARAASMGGTAAGLDFSAGMLGRAAERVRGTENVSLALGDAGRLPFSDGAFDTVTCAHAFYELRGEGKSAGLREIVRVLRPEGRFLMMEHDVPERRAIRAMFYLRLMVAAGGGALAFLREEETLLRRHFRRVRKVAVPGGRSKILVCDG